MSSAEQMEYICPTCRWRTVVNCKPEDEEQTVFCPRCEIEMKPYTKTSKITSAAANSPSESSVGGKTKAATKTTRTKSGVVKEKKPAKVKPPTKAQLKAAALAAIPPAPDFGDFRCACCGHVKTVAPGSEKPAGGFRCPVCFVKLDWVNS